MVVFSYNIVLVDFDVLFLYSFLLDVLKHLLIPFFVSDIFNVSMKF